MKKKPTRGKKPKQGTTVRTLLTGVSKPDGFSKNLDVEMHVSQWFTKQYDSVDSFLADFTPHEPAAGSFLERIKYVFDFGGEMAFRTKQHKGRQLFYFSKSIRGGKRPGTGQPKKFPGYKTKYVQTLCPVD